MDAFCATTQYGVCAEDMRTPPYSLYMRVYGSSCSHLQPSSQRVMHCLLCRQLMYACNDLPAPRYLSVLLCYTACAFSPHPPTVQHCGVLFSTLSGCCLLLAVPHEACSNLLAFKPLLASSEDSVGCRICEWFFPIRRHPIWLHSIWVHLIYTLGALAAHMHTFLAPTAAGVSFFGCTSWVV